ncbi:ATP-dependent DNA ligase domain protein [Ancylostoma ceylanicum]|uniref:ATP-dependent DNA ligase domain protein n=1 Tax=Ancylostoma ceylanicum TaxID=53326 RepID=A0A0D6LPQ8_9BILA|nr:ATP-dependent DNA ligase domain protein [Ancylostoma ceylanicum]
MLADTLKFADLCVLLSKLRDVKGNNAPVMRKKLFEKFVTSCADKCENGEDPDAAFHPVLRLVLSTLDTRSLSIKEKKLVDRVSKALAMSSADIPGANVPIKENCGDEFFVETKYDGEHVLLHKIARDQYKWYTRNGKDFTKNATKVCEVLAAEVSSRIAPDDFEHLSIAQINEKLDHMSESSETEDLQFLFKNCSQDELFWLFSIMIKNVESTIGVAKNIILSWLGPQAVARWNAARDLSEVAAATSDGEPRLGANFRPMLLARLPKEGWWEVIKENCGDEFFVETKYDGEHVLLHKIARDQYKWYTRNGKDFTKAIAGRRQFKSQNSEHRSHSFRHIDPTDNVQIEEVEQLFAQALGAGEEGIVVKRKDVTYQPGTRMTKSGWFKLKAYLGDNELDVAVVGIDKGKDGQLAYQLAVRDASLPWAESSRD